MRKENKMKISFDLTEQEYMEHISFCMRNSEIFRRKIEKMRLMLSATPALLGIIIVSVTGSKGFNFFIGIIFLTAAVFVISPMLFHKLIENKVLKIIYKKGSNILGERTIMKKHLKETTLWNIVKFSRQNRRIKRYIFLILLFRLLLFHSGFFLRKRKKKNLLIL